MLTETGCKSRQERLWNALPEQTEWVVVADPRHVQYLVNFSVNPLSFSGGERAWLLLDREQGSTLIADNFAIRSTACTAYVDREVSPTWYDHKHTVINRDHALLQAMESLADKLYGRIGAVEAEWLPVGALELLGLDHESHSVKVEAGENGSASAVDLGTKLRELRRRKEADEIALLKQCMHAGNAGHAAAAKFIKPGVSELDIYRKVQSAAVAAAGRQALVYGDFRAVNAASPKLGGSPTDYVLQAGDMFILDYSVVLDGYRSDFTNTYAVGKPTAEQQQLFDACVAGMHAGEKVLKNGVSAADVYAAASAPLEAAGYGPLAHHAGHGLGLAHPERPILVPESNDKLVTGDVITLEPGAYVKGVGGVRIEHNYLITDDGYETLSGHKIALT